jgi:hypothetical protein
MEHPVGWSKTCELKPLYFSDYCHTNVQDQKFSYVINCAGILKLKVPRNVYFQHLPQFNERLIKKIQIKVWNSDKNTSIPLNVCL